MKDLINIVNKLLVLYIALFLIVACNNITTVQEDDIKGAKVSLVLSSNSRTIMEPLELSDFTRLKVYCKCKETSGREFTRYFNSANELQTEGIWFLDEDLNKPWSFTVIAEKNIPNNSAIEYLGASKIDSLTAGVTSLNIELYFRYSGSGKGSFSLSLDFSEDSKQNLVTKAEAVLRTPNYTYNSATPVLTKTFTDFSSSKTVCFQGENISAGSYSTLISIYTGDVIIGQWQEIIQITDGCNLKKQKQIQLCQDLYKLTYNYNYGTDLQNEPMPVEQYVKTSTTNHFIPEREGYSFIGWFKNPECTQYFTFPATEDITLYAYWVPGIAFGVTNNNIIEETNKLSKETYTEDNPAKVIAVGNMGNRILRNDNTYNSAWLKNGIYVNLDLTKLENVSVLNRNSFVDCSRLKKLVLPDVLTEIKTHAVYNCTSLKSVHIGKNVTTIEELPFTGDIESITVDSENKYFKSVDGVLYTKDGKTLVYYPQNRPGTTFEIPESVSCIKEYAFAGVKNLTTVTFAADNKNWLYQWIESGVVKSGTKIIDVSNPDNNVEILKSDYESKNIYLPEQIEPLTVKTNSGNFTLVTNNGNKVVYFNIATVAGKEYTINFVTDYTKSNFTINNPENLNLGNGCIYSVGTNASVYKNIKPTSETSAYTTSFTASSAYTYIILEFSSDTNQEQQCAFEVVYTPEQTSNP